MSFWSTKLIEFLEHQAAGCIICTTLSKKIYFCIIFGERERENLGEEDDLRLIWEKRDLLASMILIPAVMLRRDGAIFHFSFYIFYYSCRYTLTYGSVRKFFFIYSTATLYYGIDKSERISIIRHMNYARSETVSWHTYVWIIPV